MRDEKRKALVDKLIHVVSNATAGSDFPTAPSPKMLILHNRVCLSGDVAREFKNICKMLQKEQGWGENLSSGFIEQAAIRLLGKILEEGNTNNVGKYLDELVTEGSDASKEYTVYLYVDGIHMQVKEVKLGQITLVHLSGEQFEDFKKQVEEEIRQGPYPENEKEARIKAWERDGFSALKDRVVAMYTGIGEASRVHDLALKEWYKVADLLRYFIFLAYQKRLPYAIGLGGEILRGQHTGLAINAAECSFHLTIKNVNPRHLLVDQEVYQAMEEQGIFDLADMLIPGRETQLSGILFRGIHWIADALLQNDPLNEFLSLISCLETFLSREQNTDFGSIGNAVACGVGWILGHDYSDRQELHNEIKGRKGKRGLYSIRSAISHGNDPGDIQKELIRLRDIVGAVAQAIVQRRDQFAIGGKDELDKWIDEGPMRPVN